MRLLLCSLAACLAAAPLAAQTPAPAATGPTHTLDEALGIARRNNPAFLQAVEGRRRSSAAVRSAYGALLPNVSSSFSAGYREGRQQFFGGVALGATGDIINSSYDVSANMRINQAALLAPRAQRATADATEADIAAGAQTLRTNVTTQYLAALQQRARAALQDTLVATAQAQLELARVRASVGSATPLDVQRAEVTLGQQRVAAIQARNQFEVERLRLFQQMGVPQPDEVQLTTEFPMEQPTVSLDQLLQMARDANPSLTATRARTRAADIGVRQAKGDYLPTLSIQTGIGGFTSQYTDDDYLVTQALGSARGQCQSENDLRAMVGLPPTGTDCAAITLPPDRVSALRATNSVFPFDFTTNPWQVSASLSMPIFNGFSREQRVQEAEVQRQEARYRTRALELQLQADVTAAYLTLTAAGQAVQIQEQSARTARQALLLAQERYRVGAGTYLDVSQANDAFARAETDRINAVYDFHRAYATLESAVGRPLR
jgi:outer membrane protein